MTDLTHLNALEFRLHNETMRLRSATCPKEIALRTVYVAQCEKEVAGELEFLGISASTADNDMSIDEILAELEA